jgi:hypothetical protein
MKSPAQTREIKYKSDTAQKAFEADAKMKLINFAKVQSDSILDFLLDSTNRCPTILLDSCFERNSGSSWYWPYVIDTALKYYIINNIIKTDTNLVIKLQEGYFKKDFICPDAIYRCGFTYAVEENYMFSKTSYFELINTMLTDYD